MLEKEAQGFTIVRQEFRDPANEFAKGLNIVSNISTGDFSGNGVRFKNTPSYDNSFNTQGIGVYEGNTYFDFSNNFHIGKLKDTHTNNYIDTFLTNNGSNNFSMEFDSQDNGVIGQIEHLGSRIKYMTTSDERLKTKIESLTPEEGLSLCLQLKPVRFNWKKNPHGKQQIGFIAQDVYKLFQMDYDKDDVQLIDYSLFTPVIVSAIQYLQERIRYLITIVNESAI